ncbi:MAG: hypothetical protein GY835_22580 [bacterium]|nr:hypothetical protein [bacterium]
MRIRNFLIGLLLMVLVGVACADDAEPIGIWFIDHVAPEARSAGVVWIEVYPESGDVYHYWFDSHLFIPLTETALIKVRNPFMGAVILLDAPAETVTYWVYETWVDVPPLVPWIMTMEIQP